jgi:hypothetical protein
VAILKTIKYGEGKLLQFLTTNLITAAAMPVCVNRYLIPDGNDTFKQATGSRDGALSILTGIAARNYIVTGLPVKTAGLTSILPQIIK